MARLLICTTAFVLFLAPITNAWALDAAIRCQIDKTNAAKRRQICLAQQEIRDLRGKTPDFQKCEYKFNADIVKADERAAKRGSSCRYVNEGDDTVSDLNTLLTWRLSLGFNSSWSQAGTNPPLPDGTAFTGYLAPLNRSGSGNGTGAAGCFAEHCDWRLATVDELITLRLDPPPCSRVPCLDPTFDDWWMSAIICPQERLIVWSSTVDTSNAGWVWGLDFCDGTLQSGGATSALDHHGLAVRGGRTK